MMNTGSDTTARGAASVGEWFDSVKTMLDAGGRVRIAPRGLSMWPTIRPATDTLILERSERYVRGDLMLGHSHEPEGVFLHRVIAVRPDGYLLMGDANTTQTEVIAPADVAGRVAVIERGARTFPPSVSCRRIFLSPKPLRRVAVWFYKHVCHP